MAQYPALVDHLLAFLANILSHNTLFFLTRPHRSAFPDCEATITPSAFYCACADQVTSVIHLPLRSQMNC